MKFDGGGGSGIVQQYIDLLPEDPGLPHSVLKDCAASEVFPADNKFDAAWLAVGASSVVYVGDDHYKESSTKSPGPTTKADPVSVTATVTKGPTTGMTPTGNRAPTQTGQSTVSSAFAAPIHVTRSILVVCGVAAVSMFL